MRSVSRPARAVERDLLEYVECALGGFVQMAGYVGRISSTLGLGEPDRVELKRIAQDLRNEAPSEP